MWTAPRDWGLNKQKVEMNDMATSIYSVVAELFDLITKKIRRRPEHERDCSYQSSEPVSDDSPGFHAAEIRRRGSKDLLKVCVLTEVGEETAEEGQPVPPQTYDLPYEGCGENDKAAVTWPDLDPRPPTEYELPWEWKKERLVRALSGTQMLPYFILNERHVSRFIVLISTEGKST